MGPSCTPDADDTALVWRIAGPGAGDPRQPLMLAELDRYRDALKSDSTFGLAAIRGAQAAAWNHRSEEAQSLIDVF